MKNKQHRNLYKMILRVLQNYLKTIEGLFSSRYRPEKHYMRGGQTAGCKNLEQQNR